MDEQKNAGQQKEETPKEVPPPAPPPIDPPQPPPNPDPEENENENKPKKSSTISDKVMIWATCVIAAGTLVSAVAIVLQWREMVGGGTQTEQIIAAANGIKTAQGQLVLDNKQVLADNRQALAKVLQENREELASALKQNRDALQAQTAASNGQLAAIQQQTEIGARPWLKISEIALTSGITIDMNGEARTAVHVIAQNIGKTPAREVSLMVELAAYGNEHQEVERLCTMSFVSTKQMGKYGQVLFPTDMLGEHETKITGIKLKPLTIVERKPTGAESLRLDKNGPPPSQEEIIFTVPSSVIGCVQYKSFTSDTLYYTGFTYSLESKGKGIDAIVYNVRFDRKTGEATAVPSKTLKGNGSITIPFEWIGLAPHEGWGNDVVR
jgi:hypothetical protein